MTWERLIYTFKVAPFNMSFAEISEMTFKQATILIEELNRDKTERYKKFQDVIRKHGKDSFPVFNVTEGILNG